MGREQNKLLEEVDDLFYLNQLKMNENEQQSTTEPYIVLPGPEDVPLHYHNGLYQQSVTLTARMWPPIEAGSPKVFWGLPANVWYILISCIAIFLLILAALFICCWLLPRRRKILSPARYIPSDTAGKDLVSGRGIIMAHHSSVIAKPWAESNYLVMPTSVGLVPPQYSAPPPPNHHPHYQINNQYTPTCTAPQSNSSSIQNIPETHKSMWAINPLYASNSVLNETDTAYRTRSLPVWGKSKPRPVSTTDDLEELYAKVNFSKKRKNRMRNGEAAIIALCRSRSQNLQGLPLEREGVVVYDERTAL